MKNWYQEPMFDPSEEDLYQMALRVPLEEKIEKAIDLIRCFEQQALNLSDEGYYVCFSGGKDSIVLAKLFEMSGVKYTLNYNNVTIDPPELVRFIKKEYQQAIWHNPKEGNLPMYMKHKSIGPPTRLSRWCCEIYKEQGGAGYSKAIGVRAAESARRKGLWKTVNQHNKDKTPILCPILYWTDENIWEFIRINNMPYCTLYDEGFKRLGCVGCPIGGKKRIEEFKRWPKYEAMWKRGFQAFWDKYHGTKRKDGKDREWLNKFESVDQLWSWWLEEKNVHDTDQPDCQMYLW